MTKTKQKKSPRAGEAKAPKWLTDHFEEALSGYDELRNIIRISQNGIAGLRGVPKVLETLAILEDKAEDSDSDKKLENAKNEASLAQTEIQNDFPVLHGFAIVALWGWLENFVMGLLALWLRNRKDALDVPSVRKIKIRWGEFSKLTKIEQADMMVELLNRDISSPLKMGINRFSSLLQPFGLSIEMPDECSNALFELQQIRNNIAHRNGIVDRRLRSNCPHLKFKLNQPVKVSTEMYRRYMNAAAMFHLWTLYRIGDIYGHDLRPKDAGDK